MIGLLPGIPDRSDAAATRMEPSNPMPCSPLNSREKGNHTQSREGVQRRTRKEMRDHQLVLFLAIPIRSNVPPFPVWHGASEHAGKQTSIDQQALPGDEPCL